MAKKDITERSADYSQWYLDIVNKAELADYSSVRGCMVIKPHGYAIWETIQKELDKRIKETGHVNAYFPLLIPQSYLQKEADHVKGFAPEVAVVTKAGGEDLAEPLVIRPTSEAIVGESYSKWVHSWRDLPIMINQWANVVRWEMRTRPFLRTSEFLWQEGHTAHASEKEAETETLNVLNKIYADFAERVLAVPVIVGQKSEKEKFAGALRTYAIEAMMQDGKALQMGTSHNLGQNFAKAFNIQYQTEDNITEYAWTTSWGVSTRLIGGLIMAHSDDDGLVCPPLVAPVQVVIVPISDNEKDQKSVMEVADEVYGELKDNYRVKLDDRDFMSAGFKFNGWEVKGVPVRIEIGPRDVESGSVVMARRDIPGKDGKITVKLDEVAKKAKDLLDDIQDNLFYRAKKRQEQHLINVNNYDEFKKSIEGNFVKAYWAGTSADEDKIQQETKATIRVIPFDQPKEAGKCFYTGKEATKVAIFAKSY